MLWMDIQPQGVAMATGVSRKKRTSEEMFIDAVNKMAGPNGMAVNKDIKEQLGWADDKYILIKDKLIANGSIYVAKGRGGYVGIVNKEEDRPLKVFISYSHQDEKIKDELLKHLAPLKRNGLISEWHDRLLQPGANWKNEISKNLVESDIVILLISIDFINSDYCYESEMEQAILRNNEGLCRVVPVLARPCLWNETPFSKIQALPKDAKPISIWDSQDEALGPVDE